MNASDRKSEKSMFDVIIVGAGISGINAAYHIQKQLPNSRYTILETRNCIGGTWDLFRYPGIRSDTDLHNFGFPWSPWKEDRAIADGASIKKYLENSASEAGITSHIKFNHRVASANWSSEDKAWNLQVDTDKGGLTTFHSRFLLLGTGYYDYTEPLVANIPGLRDNFKGTTIHPQFWPEDFDYTDKNIVIVGSGATAITLLPNLANKAKKVTMLQRSPTYIMSVNNSTAHFWSHKILPKSWSFQLDRLFFMCMITISYYFCRAFPSRSRAMLQDGVSKQLPKSLPLEPHFKPTYQPWDQRVCFTPDGDFFESIRGGKATVETGRIDKVTENSIILKSGKEIPADVIVTATGLKLAIGGRIQFRVDKEPIDLANRYAWNSAMLQDVPNLAFFIGYTNASWTLGTEAAAYLVCRLLSTMKKNQLSIAVPRVAQEETLEPRPIWNLKATYVKEADGLVPKCGDSGPWKGRSIYLFDLLKAKYGDITSGLEFS